jgi:dipeptidyl-peptidase-3
MASGREPSNFILETGVVFGNFHVEPLLRCLTPQQLEYATYLALASWAGAPILLSQASREALGIHAFLSALSLQYPAAALEAAVPATDGAVFFLLEYAAGRLYQGGNYLDLGKRKFIPRIAKADLIALVGGYPDLSVKLAEVVDAMYDVLDDFLTFGWPPDGVTAHCDPRDFTKEEGQAVDDLLKAEKIRSTNTTVPRLSDRYDVRRISIKVDDVGFQIGELNRVPVSVTKACTRRR